MRIQQLSDFINSERTDGKAITVNKSVIDKIHGRDTSDLNSDEKEILNAIYNRGRSFGIAISLINSAPASKVMAVKSSSEYDALMSSYPTVVSLYYN